MVSPRIDSLLYVSRASLKTRQGDAEVRLIVEMAIRRNNARGITGALIFTEEYFAQMLEGPQESIEKLMGSIRRDTRHTDLHIIDEKKGVTRRFPQWSLAYAGPSLFINRHVAVVKKSATSASPADVIRLIDLLTACVSAGSRPTR